MQDHFLYFNSYTLASPREVGGGGNLSPAPTSDRWPSEIDADPMRFWRRKNGVWILGLIMSMSSRGPFWLQKGALHPKTKKNPRIFLRPFFCFRGPSGFRVLRCLPPPSKAYSGSTTGYHFIWRPIRPFSSHISGSAIAGIWHSDKGSRQWAIVHCILWGWGGEDIIRGKYRYI